METCRKHIGIMVMEGRGSKKGLTSAREEKLWRVKALEDSRALRVHERVVNQSACNQ